MKVRGKSPIPDYIQLRDDEHRLIDYFRADRPFKNLKKYGLEGKEEQLRQLIENLPFGKMDKLNI
jgi:hypothetical protein